MIYGKCDGCHKRKLFIKQRSYKIPQLGKPITSKGKLCRSCYKSIKKMVNI